jgi:hypothetical protein
MAAAGAQTAERLQTTTPPGIQHTPGARLSHVYLYVSICSNYYMFLIKIPLHAPPLNCHLGHCHLGHDTHISMPN